jgi:trans-aconitate methyltransferase
MTNHDHSEAAHGVPSGPVSGEEHRAHWEERYSGDSPWSGKPNAPMVDELTGVPSTGRTALDLGCGAGADTVWLAEQGWQVTGADIAEAALRHAAQAVDAAGVTDHVELVRTDLDSWEPDRTWDLVVANFLHSQLVPDRDPLLKRALRWVAPGGSVLLLSHLHAPTWLDHHFAMPSLQEVVDFCSGPGWTVVSAREAETDLPSPDGQPGTRVDTLVRVVREA